MFAPDASFDRLLSLAEVEGKPEEGHCRKRFDPEGDLDTLCAKVRSLLPGWPEPTRR
jgi:hypothetical protein